MEKARRCIIHRGNRIRKIKQMKMIYKKEVHDIILNYLLGESSDVCDIICKYLISNTPNTFYSDLIFRYDRKNYPSGCDHCRNYSCLHLDLDPYENLKCKCYSYLKCKCY